MLPVKSVQYKKISIYKNNKKLRIFYTYEKYNEEEGT